MRLPESITAHLAGVTPVDVPPSMVETADDARARHEAARAATLTRWVPPEYAAATLGDITWDTDRKLAGWWGGGRRNLLIHGPYDTEKSRTAYAVASDAVRAHGVGFAAYTATDLMHRLRPDHTDPEHKHRVRRLVGSVPLLLLDDIGQETLSSWVVETWHDLLGERNRSGLRTIITTNLGKERGEDAQKRYGGAVSSRMTQDALIVASRGVPHRRQRVESW